METYSYPTSLDGIDRTTVFQIKDPVTDEWSIGRRCGKLCSSKQDMILSLIRRKGIRIVIEDYESKQ